MRIRFASYLAIGIVSAFLIVASYAFAAHTFWWIALIGGIALQLLGLAALASARPSVMLAAPAAISALLGPVPRGRHDRGALTRRRRRLERGQHAGRRRAVVEHAVQPVAGQAMDLDRELGG